MLLEKKTLIISTFFALFSIFNAQSTAGCGSTFGCYLSPAGCSGSNCNYIFKWADSGSQTKFEIHGKTQPGVPIDGAWLAAGFSDDRRMGGSNVVMCTSKGTTRKAEHNVNTVRNTALLDSSNPTIGLSSISVTINNDYIICTFTRDKSKTATGYANLANLDNVPLYAVMATGPIWVDRDVIQYHGTYKEMSPTTIDFTKNIIYNSDSKI